MKSIAIILILFAGSIGTSHAQYKDWIAPSDADKISNPYKDNVSTLKEGKKLYVQMCAMCHGDTGKGDGIAGIAIDPRPANFNSPKIRGQSDGALFWKMTYGRAPMLAYRDILTEDQRWGLVNYIRDMNKKNK